MGLWVIAAFVVVPVAVLSWAWIDRPTDQSETVTGTITALRVETSEDRPSPHHLIITVMLSHGSPVKCTSLRGGVGDRVSLTAHKSRLLGRRLIKC
jgi:hypothetical protein